MFAIKRKVRDEEEARACLGAAADSGLDRAEWARQHGIDGRSLNAWRLILARRAELRRLRPSARLVELVRAPPVESARYIVRCGDLAVEVDDRFDEATLRRLLRAVSEC